jgi:hypothetical protein
MARGVVRVSVRSARRPGFRPRGVQRRTQTAILDVFAGDLAPRLTRLFRGFAPRRTGRLERGLRANVTSRGGRIGVTVESSGAVSDEGFPYLDVTRFGHRTNRIVPKHRGAHGRPAALAFDGIVVRSTRGYHPSRDWVEEASAAADAALDEAQRQLGRKVESAVL